MNLLPLSWKLLCRDWRSGELRLIFCTLAVTVAAMSSVGFFTDRVRGALERQPSRLLAADLAISSGQALPPELAAEAQAAGLDTAHTLEFRSMAEHGEELQLVEVKAVSAGYPLRGSLRIADRWDGADRETQALPAPGEAWADPRLARTLGLEPGTSVRLGEAQMTVSQILALEPDRGGRMFNLAPRLLIRQDDIPATGLLGAGSRVKHRLLVRGEDKAVQALRQRIEARANPAWRLRSPQDARPEMRAALDRAGQFLRLASLVSIALAGLALALASRQYVERRLAHCALLRCLGCTHGRTTGLFVLQLAWLALLSSLPGCALGYLGQAVLSHLLTNLAATGELPPASIAPWAMAPTVSLLAMLGFCLPQLWRLHRVSPMQVLRRDPDAAGGAGRAAVCGAALLALAALMPWQNSDAKLTAWMLAGILASVLFLTLCAWLGVRLLGRLRRHASISWRYGLASIARRPGDSIAQLVGIGAGLTALLILTLVRGDLLESWRGQLPEDTPNYFLVNIQPDEVAAMRDFLQRHADRPVELHPMVRGRMTAINGRSIRPEDYPEGEGRELARWDFNLSWAAALSPDNRVVEGQWWTPRDASGAQYLSLEREAAAVLGIALDDELSFRIADREVRAQVRSLRQVQWDSFRVNFYAIANPGWLDAHPATWITSIYLPPGRSGLLRDLAREFPAVTILDVDALLRQVRAVMDQVSRAVEFVFLFTLMAGLLVMAAALQLSAGERRREGALLRALGAGGPWILRGHITEFLSLGGVAGVLAAGTAHAATWLLARQALNLEFHPQPLLWGAGLAAGLLLVPAAGLLGTRAARRQSPMAVLRRG